MLVVKFYIYDKKLDKYFTNCQFCNSVEACADGNIKMLVCNLDPDDPGASFIIKASQLISIRVKEGK